MVARHDRQRARAREPPAREHLGARARREHVDAAPRDGVVVLAARGDDAAQALAEQLRLALAVGPRVARRRRRREVEAAEAKVKEFERKNVQTVSEMKQQANKDIEEALASARAKFAKEKEVLTRKIDEERRQSRLEVEREKKRFQEELKSKELALQQKNDKLIDEITLEFRREIKSRGPR